jgi:branched-chain amino acid transport system substrate-binding protein
MGEGGAFRPVRNRAETIMAMAAFIAVGAACASTPADPREREVLLGGLFSLTGEYAWWGSTNKSAMELAIEDVNRYLEDNAAGIRIAPAIEDVQFDAQLALEKTRALHERGVRILIGPPTSEQVAHLTSFIDSHGMLLVSPSSTAGSLAVAGDNILRFTPSDSLQGVAVSAMMWEDGVRAMVPVWRDDPSGTGLASAARAAFTARGGTTFQGVAYSTETEDFDATIAALRTQVDDAVAAHGADRVGIYLIAFGEVVGLFALADTDPALRSLRWYGSDATARLEALSHDSRAAEFALRTGFPSPVFGIDAGARDIWEPLVARIRDLTDQEADARALAVYDAVWVVARGYIASGATQDVETLKRAVTTAADRHFGATGWTALNEAGDRRHGDFDFWAIRRLNGVLRWTRVAVYESRMERMVR